MKYILKEATPRQNNIELPITFLTTKTPKEYKLLYGQRQSFRTPWFTQKKTTQHYDEWFAQRDDTKIPLNLTPLHAWFAVPGINISKAYWEIFFLVHPDSALALHFQTKELHKEKLTLIRHEGYPVNVYWTVTAPDIKKAIPLSPPITYLKPEEQIQVALSTGDIGFIYKNIIPIYITFHCDATNLLEPLPNLIFEFLREKFILYRSFIVSPCIDHFTDNRILTGFGFRNNGDLVRYYG